jgi:ERCC4-type nuclease
MRVIIDNRERDLFERCYSITQSTSTYVTLEKEPLPIGDVYFKTDEGKDVLIIERKSLSDLLASIKDGRYEEQSYRLMHSSGFPPHSVIYIIEGQMTQLRTSMEKRLVYSAMTSLNFFKGFSVIRTNHISETADFIIWTAEKIERNFLKSIFPYYLKEQYAKYMKMPVALNPTEDCIERIEQIDNEPIQDRSSIAATTDATEVEPEVATMPTPMGSEPATEKKENYSTVVKKVKKDKITVDNIGEILLCQIPGISSVTAIAIMREHKTFPQLMKAMAENPNVLDTVCIETNGKLRKINKTTIENIKKYLL